MRTARTLIRLGESEYSLGAQVILLVYRAVAQTKSHVQ